MLSLPVGNEAVESVAFPLPLNVTGPLRKLTPLKNVTLQFVLASTGATPVGSESDRQAEGDRWPMGRPGMWTRPC